MSTPFLLEWLGVLALAHMGVYEYDIRGTLLGSPFTSGSYYDIMGTLSGSLFTRGSFYLGVLGESLFSQTPHMAHWVPAVRACPWTWP